MIRLPKALTLKLKTELLVLLHHHPPHRRGPERQRPDPVRLDLELPHQADEPLVRVTGRVEAVTGRQAEGHDRVLERRVRVLAADGDAGNARLLLC